MSHGLTAGRYQVPLIGAVKPHERRPNYWRQGLSNLLDWWHPEKRRKRIEAERNPKVREILRATEARKSKGRPRMKIAGTWITDLAELKQCVMLCGSCEPKWKPIHKRYGYRLDTAIQRATGGVYGTCDACRESFLPPYSGKLAFYIHESYVGVSYQIPD